MTKNSPHFKKFTLTLWVAWVTNMRYGNCKDDSDGGGDDDDNDDDNDDYDDNDDDGDYDDDKYLSKNLQNP